MSACGASGGTLNMMCCRRRSLVWLVRHFRIRYQDLAVHFLLAQLREREFRARVAGERGPGHALRLDARAVDVERHLVLLREALERALDRGVVDGDVVFLRLLQLNAFEHHLVEHLPLQLRGRRHRRVLLLQPARDEARAVLEFALRNHVVIDDRHDRVGKLHIALRQGLGTGRRTEKKRCGECARCQRYRSKHVHVCHRYSIKCGQKPARVLPVLRLVRPAFHLLPPVRIAAGRPHS
jgi:hypothetical protein